MIISQTPLRISFLGGGTDYPEHFLSHGGAVLGTAVDKFAFFSMARFYSALFDYSIRISYRQVECVRSLDEIQHAPFRECLRSAGLNRDIEISTEELHAFIDGELDPVRTAEIAQLIAANPDLARRIQAFRSDKERLGQVYGTLDELPLPPNLLQFGVIGNWEA